MELLKEPKYIKSPFIENEIAKRLNDLRQKTQGMDLPLANAALSMLAAKLHGEPGIYEEALESWRGFSGHPDFARANDLIHYIIRGGRVFAIKHPYSYMDVYPFVTIETTCKSFFKKQIPRDRLADICGAKKFKHYSRASCNDIKRVINNEINKYTAKEWCRKKVGSKLVVHFDGRRIIKKMPQPLHFYNIMIGLGFIPEMPPADSWEDVVKLYTDHVSGAKTTQSTQFAMMQSINYRIIRDMAYDVLHGIILASECDLDIWLADDRLDGISYFFVRLGNSICHRDVSIIFEDSYDTIGEWTDACRRGQFISAARVNPPISPRDISAVIATYLHQHEIYRFGGRGSVDVPSILPPEKLTVRGANPLYAKLRGILNKWYEGFLPSRQYPTDMQSVEDIAQEILSEWDNMAQGTQKIMLVAIPGTGKTTYTRTLQGFVSINSDLIMERIRINGMLPSEALIQCEQEISADCADLPPRLRKAMVNSMIYGMKRIIYGPYRGIARLVEKRLFEAPRQPNLIYETPLFSRFTNQPIVKNTIDDCNNLVPEISREMFDLATEVVLLYNTIEKIYVQHLNRSIVEHRASRWYSLSYYFYANLNMVIPEKYKSKVTVFGLDDSRDYKVILKLGRIQPAWEEYSAAACGALKKFLKQFSHEVNNI